MFNLAHHLAETSADVVFIQYNGGPLNYETVPAMVRRNVDTGDWTFQTLMEVDGWYHSGAPYRGDIGNVARIAEYQLGISFGTCHAIPVNYTDEGFPSSLLPR